MIAFYADVNFHKAIVHGLRLRGVDVLTAQTDGFGRRSDDQVLDRTLELGRVVLSHDKDMTIIASSRVKDGKQFAGVIHISWQNVDIGRCIDDLELYAKTSRLEDCTNTVTYLPLPY